MVTRHEGVAVVDDDDDAGFRVATRKAVDDYKAMHGAPKQGEPVKLRVADMYVRVQNPIHEYIVVLETQP